jgi:Xaa-Pro aminopeptidase
MHVICTKETRTLKAGMCFTIEPTIRVPKKIFSPVEDDVVVTKNGYEPFKKVPRDFYRIK